MNEIWTWIRSQLTVNDVGSLTGERERPDSGERDRFAGLVDRKSGLDSHAI